MIMKTLLILPLVLLMIVAPSVALATNESSYKIGYHGAFDIFRCLAHPLPSGSSCDDQGYTFNQYDVCMTNDFKPVSNETACADGYASGFVHWCASNLADCIKQVRADAIPHMLNK